MSEYDELRKIRERLGWILLVLILIWTSVNGVNCKLDLAARRNHWYEQ